MIDSKEGLKVKIARLNEKKYIISDKSVVKSLQEIIRDVDNDIYTVVVLGEFKRGKSTFVNALLGLDLLPTSVLPETATINALTYSEEPCVTVVFKDGHEEKGDLSLEFLSNFSASRGQTEFETISYLKIGYPAEILKNRVAFVDTPGVSDINESRCEVTYGFIPKANAVLFLLDANSPLKKTEKEFIDEHLLPLGLDKVVFVVNKYDAVDEDEDADIIETVRDRIKEAFKTNAENVNWAKDVKIYPLSAKWALQGKKENRSDLLEMSGLYEIERVTKSLLVDGSVEQDKLHSYEQRLQRVLVGLCSKYENEKKLKLMSGGQLKRLGEQLEEMLNKQNETRGKIAEYVNEKRQEIKNMFNKSLQEFCSKVLRDISDDIRVYHGADFKNYIEERIVLQIQRKFEAWVSAYTSKIDKVLADLQKELSDSLAHKFKQKLTLCCCLEHCVTYERGTLRLETQDVKSANVQAGLIYGGMTMAAYFLGVPMFLPMIGMTALPTLREQLLESKVQGAKEQVMPVINNEIVVSVDNLTNSVMQDIDAGCDMVINNTECQYDKILSVAQETIKKQLSKQSLDKEKIDEEIRRLDVVLNEIREFMK